jgi:ribosomal protein S18 acetylase RimI-like enzyme
LPRPRCRRPSCSRPAAGSTVARVDEIVIRPAEIERDAGLIRSLDTSFETGAIFEVQSSGRAFQLVETAVDPPVTKTFAVDLHSEHEWERTWLALAADRTVGVVATQQEAWNRRVIIWHLYVDVGRRRQGIGSRLVDTALSSARQAGARTAWAETSNLNLPGVRAYERLGFQLCGLDTSLYEATPAEGEVALFLRRSLRRS